MRNDFYKSSATSSYIFSFLFFSLYLANSFKTKQLNHYQVLHIYVYEPPSGGRPSRLGLYITIQIPEILNWGPATVEQIYQP